MLESIEVENFRGFERLSVAGFGRVNLVIGHNNAGKTALLEATRVAAARADVLPSLLGAQWMRTGDNDFTDFHRSVATVFRDEDTRRGFAVRGWWGGHAFRQTVCESSPTNALPGTLYRETAVDVEFVSGNESPVRTRATFAKGGVTLPPSVNASAPLWVDGSTSALDTTIDDLSRILQRSGSKGIVDALRLIDPRIESVELLAPGGRARVFLRSSGTRSALPLALFGDGTRRIFDYAVSCSIDNASFIAIDEVDAGLHYSVLPEVWRWFSRITTERNIQVFASTHSEECIRAAAEAFGAGGDDGLRVIRLTRDGSSTRAAVYDRKLVEVAMESSVELRG